MKDKSLARVNYSLFIMTVVRFRWLRQKNNREKVLFSPAFIRFEFDEK